MKRVWAGFGLLTMAGLGSAVLAAPSGAGEDKPEPEFVLLDSAWSPNPAEPGAAVTLTPTENCTFDVDSQTGETAEPGVVLLFTDLDGDEEFADLPDTDPLDEVKEAPMAEDGSWSLDWTAPEDEGEYIWEGVCQNSAFEEELTFCGLDTDEEEVVADEFKEISYSKPVAPAWPGGFDCVFEIYEAPLTVGVPDTPPTTPTPPPATPIEAPPNPAG